MSRPQNETESTFSNSTVTRTEFTSDISSISGTLLDESTTAGDLGRGDTQNVSSPLPQNGKQRIGWQRYLGVLYTIYGIFMTSMGTVLLGLLSHVHPLTINLYGYLIGTCTSAPFVWYKYKVENRHVMETILPLGQHKKILFFMWLRSTCTVILTFTLCWTVPYNPMSDARTIYATTVITVNVLGCLWFKENLGILKVIVFTMIVIGVGIMTKTPFLNGGKDLNEMNVIAFCGMISSSINMLVLRYLHHVYHGVRNVFLFSWAFLSTLPFAIALEKLAIPQWTSWDIAGIAGYGIVLSLANTFFAWALKEDEVGIVALVRTGEYVLGSCWKMILLKQFLDLSSSLGAVLALTGVIVVVLHKWLQGKDENSPVRKRFKWMIL